MTLPTQTIGPFSVSATSLGCMDLSHTYGEKPGEANAVRLLNHALDAASQRLGTDHIDL